MLGRSLEELKAQMRPDAFTTSPCAPHAHAYIAYMIAPVTKTTAKHNTAVMAGQVESPRERRKRGYKSSFEIPFETAAEWDLNNTIRRAKRRGATVGAAAFLAAAAAANGTHATVSRRQAHFLLETPSLRTELEGRRYLSHLSDDRDLRKNLDRFAGVQHLWAAWYTIIQESLGRGRVHGLPSVRDWIAVHEEERPQSGRDLAPVTLELENCKVLERFEALAAFYDDALDQRDEAPWFDLARVAQGRVHPDWTYCKGILASVRASLA